MGIIHAGISSLGGSLSDQWLEVVEPLQMDNTTIMSKGVSKSKDAKRGANKKGTTDVITDGSLIQVGENQFMMLVDGGKIIDYSAEAGYFKVDNQNAPSLFNGGFGGALSDAYNRFKFGGITPYSQEVFYINTQEIQNIPFGTPNPINYFDDFYNAELYVRAHGYYSIKIVNPIKFYTTAAPKNSDYVGIDELRKLYLSEFLTAFQTAIGKLSVDGARISHLSSKTTELSKHMADILDESWEQARGMKIESVGIASLTYDESSKKLIDMRNQGAMLKDADVRTGYVQGAAARGLEAAGSNPGGAAAGFIGYNMANQSGANIVGSVNQSVQQQQSAAAQQPPADSWTCPKCAQQGNAGNFCQNCGTPRPQATQGKFCTNCGFKNLPEAKFCQNCGNKL